MRFAFKTSPQNTSWDNLLAVWREADTIPLYESGWTSDHFHPTHSADPAVPRFEGWITLAALAQATARLRFGTLVTGVHYRHPAVLANMAATLDVISGGRLEIGIGAGWNAEESDAYGIELGTPRERSDRLEEACAVLVGLLSPQPTLTFTGRHYRLADARCEPKPVQRPHPPLCIGGSGAARTLRTAARFAQHWNFDTGPLADFRKARDILHGHCADLGRDPAEIRVSAQLRYAGDPSATAAEAAAFAEAGADLGIVYLPTPYTPSVLEPLASALEQVG
ncbi:TIGR03560 family F420-dependent LLM class oxidoreductase [Streptacidiphilus fuscans]|uniref:TIGR03560 family F420-dependent LLM class oxidoreductase n=1 Tax=Streptacidiphilus fuscans TaxID=2789292 RepID=A0A931B6K0_9ACTN|nr:TIGR03560 family F420-dependent LLM class oxidoreductase [Streptacidiphilus fuscans]MBF9068783.1 TIGR03560 family F420-dependent LLM class oxidoreductase [Streptacidiphilus fuscans]